MDYEKKYKEALERAKNTIDVNQAIPDIVECVKSLFPELAESRDEEIRKSITEFFKNYSERGTWKAIPDVTKWIDWLEKQGDQDNNEDSNILQRFSFYSYKDEPNILYLSSLYVNEEYRNNGIGTKILEVADEVAKSLNCHAIRLKTKKDSDAERLYRTHGYNSLVVKDKGEIWLEKQCEPKPACKMQVSDELYEHIRNTCACIDDALSSKSFADINDYLSMAECSAQSAFDMIEKQSEQKPDDKAEPKFKVGDWCIDNEDGTIFQIVKVLDNTYTYKTNKGKEYSCSHYSLENDARFWTIQDAKDGDVLVDEGNNIGIYKEIEGLCWRSYIYLGCDNHLYGFSIGGSHMQLHSKPATKEQCDNLFAKMKEAGYEWDADKKQLKKINSYCQENCKGFQETGKCFADWECKAKREAEAKQKSAKLSEEDEDMIRYIGNAITCEESAKYLKEKGVDIIKAHCWLDSLKSQFKLKQEWSEEDEAKLKSILFHIEDVENKDVIDWLKALKDRVQPQLQQEWSEEDESRMDNLCHFLEEYGNQYYGHLTLQGTISWVKFLKDRVQPQPKHAEWSEEDEKMLNDILMCGEHHCYLDAENIDWLKALKGRVQLQPNKEWSEEDENRFKNLIELVEQSNEGIGTKAGFVKFINELKSLKPQPKQEWSEDDEYYYGIIQYILNDECVGKTDKENAINWFKSLRPQSKQEWSEEDERNASYICAALECYYRLREERNNTNGQEDLNKARNWLYNKLKSLNPYNRWKPSDEQITWLYRAADEASKDSRMKQILNELLSDLKKLMGK